MFKYIKQYRFYIILFLFILIPIIAIDTSTRSPRTYRFYDRIIVNLTSPVQIAISWTLETIVSGFENYIFLWNLRKENELLTEENRRLMNTIIHLQETRNENQRLRELLDFKEKFDLKTVIGRVIAKDVSTEFRAIRINRGADHGIMKDMAVLNNQGVVGRILRTTATTSDVVTILDLLSGVDAIVERSRARGIVEGMTDEICLLKFVLRTDDIQPGDLLLSSGLGGVFPKGVPVGTVSSVFRRPFGVSQRVEIRPSVDFSKLEEVMVVTDSDSSPMHVASNSVIQIPTQPNPETPSREAR